jgi:MFS family permease
VTDDSTTVTPRDPDLAHNLRVNLWHGALQNAAITLVSAFLGIDLIRLGGTNWEVGLLSALPPLANTLSALLGARWMSRRANPRRATLAVFLLARLTFVALAVVNLAANRLSPMLLVLLVGVMNIPQAVGTVSWQAIVTGLFPESVRPRAFSTRAIAQSLAGIAIPLLGGFLIRDVRGVSGYPALDGAAFLIGLGEVWLFSRLRGNPAVQTLPPTLWPAFRRLWGVAAYRRYTLASLPFYFGWVMAWPLFLRYQVDDAHASNLWMVLLPATNSAFQALLSRVWGKLGERFSPGLLLPLAVFGLSFVPFVYAWHPNLLGLLLSNVIGGAMGAGVNLFLLLRLMQVTPEGDRIIGMGLANTLIGTAGVVGPLVATALALAIPIPAVFWIPFGLRFLGGAALLAAYWGLVIPRRFESARARA